MVDRKARRQAKKEQRAAERASWSTGPPVDADVAFFADAERDPEWREALTVAGDELKKARTAAAAVAAASAIYAITDRYLTPPVPLPLACKSGCSYCCNVLVEVSIPELAAAIDFARKTLPPDRLQRIAEVARQNGPRAHGQHPLWYPRLPCAFLADGVCAVYAARPLTCRREHSLDAGPCRRYLELPLGQDVDVSPRNRELYRRGSLMVAALEYSLLKAKWDARSYELQESLATALDDPTAIERHLAGEQPFAASYRDPGMLAKFAPHRYAALLNG